MLDSEIVEAAHEHGQDARATGGSLSCIWDSGALAVGVTEGQGGYSATYTYLANSRLVSQINHGAGVTIVVPWVRRKMDKAQNQNRKTESPPP